MFSPLSLLILATFASVFGILGVLSDRPIDWFTLDCPTDPANTTCTYTNQYDVDIAVSLFFQTEDNSGSHFTCEATTSTTPVTTPHRTRKHGSKKTTALRNIYLTRTFGSSLACPNPMVFKYYNHWSYCLLENITFPDDLSKVGEYCDYVTQGYEGFYFSTTDFPDYKCPSSMQQSTSSDGTTFCVFNLPSNITSQLPNDTQSYCSDYAFENSMLGFRFDQNGSTTMPPTTPVPSTQDTGNIIYCSRRWVRSGAQYGSAGDCFFIVPSGTGFNCYGNGDTTMITAYAVQLNDSYLDGSGNSDMVIDDVSKFTNENAGQDAMIYIEFESMTNSLNMFDCYYNDDNIDNNDYLVSVCNISMEHGAGGIYSCNFILPAMNTVYCDYDSSKIVVNSAMQRLFKETLVNSTSSVVNNNNNAITQGQLCPNSTYPDATFCDCYYENPYSDNDLLIIINAVNTDDQFNSFHCFVYGVNVCAWGANNNNQNDSGNCYFILPAQSMYNCSMEWGSTAFLQTTAIKLDTSLLPFDDSSADKPVRPEVKGNKLPYSRSYESMLGAWKRWKLRYNKEYVTKEEEMVRFDNFRHFVSLTDNNAKVTVMNKYRKYSNDIFNENADLSIDEFNSLYKDCAFSLDDENIYDKETHMFKIPGNIDTDNLPNVVDWRDKGAITPVKNQGQCGSCWAFSTTGVLESHYFLYKNELQSLSEQDLVSCDDRDGNDGCDGGFPYKAIEYVANNYIDTEASYNYTSGSGDDGVCRQTNGVTADVSYAVSNYSFIESEEVAMASYVANYGPISISLDAMTQIWWPYTNSSGIMNNCCDKDVDHAVLIVGYNMMSEDSKEHYWIIKNSWGTDWGYNGYIYLQMGTNQCGITSQPVVPVFN